MLVILYLHHIFPLYNQRSADVHHSRNETLYLYISNLQCLLINPLHSYPQCASTYTNQGVYSVKTMVLALMLRLTYLLRYLRSGCRKERSCCLEVAVNYLSIVQY